MRKSLSLALLLALLALGATSTDTSLTPVEPESVGFSSERLGRISSFFKRYVEEEKLAGLATLVARHGKVAHFETHGYADLESRRPLEKDSIYRIYSMTKPIVGVAMMILFEEGKYQLDDPVSKYIPEFKDLKVDTIGDDGELILEDTEREMTVRHLMTHTSGLTYGGFSRSDVDTLYQEARLFSGTIKEMIGKLSKLPLRQQPGSMFHYSVSVDVQGYLIEVLSGQPLDDFLEQRIFRPLGMRDTGFHVPEEKLARLTTNYGPPRGDDTAIRVLDHPSRSRYSRPPEMLSGGGGLVSTLHDYLRFCQMLLNGGQLDGVRILGPRTVRLMSRNHLPARLRQQSPESGMGFGLNVAVMLDPVAAGSPGSKGEYYWGGLASTLFWIDPEEDLTAILMTQFIPSSHYPLREQFRSLVYQALVD